jgi:hypothetical protein
LVTKLQAQPIVKTFNDNPNKAKLEILHLNFLSQTNYYFQERYLKD